MNAPTSTDSIPFQLPRLERPEKDDEIPLSTLMSDNYYMNRRRRGVALIFNHYQFESDFLSIRKGTDIDVVALQETLPYFGFDARIFNDLRRNHILDVIIDVCREDHSDADCIAVFVLTHGESNRLHAYDAMYAVEELWTPFTKCRSLVGKPKLFFLQACRGTTLDGGVTLNGTVLQADAVSDIVFSVPAMADVVLMYSTVDGYASFRNSIGGTPFIQVLCKEFKERGSFIHFEDVMLHVRKRIAFDFASYNPRSIVHNSKQIPQICSTLTKFIFFTQMETRVIEELQRETNRQISEIHLNRNKIEENISLAGKLNDDDEFIKVPTCEDAVRVTVLKNDRFYNMSHRRRGEALIFSHKEYTLPRLRKRSGTVADEKLLKSTLEKLKFNVTIHRDLTKVALRKTLEDAAEKNYDDCDCLVIVVLSHGKDNKIYAKDDAYCVDDLWTPFTGETSKCKSLVGKPKLFFLQACRGSDIATGLFVKTEGNCNENMNTDDDDSHVYTIPYMADVLVMYATAQGFVAFSGDEGSLFVKKICQELHANANKMHLEDMMLNVKRNLAVNLRFDTNPATGSVFKQIPQLNSTLTRYVFFGGKMNQFKPSEYAF